MANELREFDSRIDGLVRVVHNAIDSVACRRTARRTPLPDALEAHQYLLSVGKFETKKGHDVLIGSYERIAPSHPNLSLVIIGGSGPALAACRELVAASPFKERMLLCCDAPHDSTLAAIARATVYTLPSRRERFGIVILEAAALAIPVVASLVGGIPWASRWPVQAPVASPRGRPPLTQPAALVATSNRNRLFRPTLAIRNRRR
jgi:glycosyltransferase involved in cell wall biosynthesis